MQEGPFQVRLDGLCGDGGVGTDVVQHRALPGPVNEHHRGGRGQVGLDPVDVEMRRGHRLAQRTTEEVVTGRDDEAGLDAHAGQHAPGAQRRSALSRRERVDEPEDADGQAPTTPC